LPAARFPRPQNYQHNPGTLRALGTLAVHLPNTFVGQASHAYDEQVRSDLVGTIRGAIIDASNDVKTHMDLDALAIINAQSGRNHEVVRGKVLEGLSHFGAYRYRPIIEHIHLINNRQKGITKIAQEIRRRLDQNGLVHIPDSSADEFPQN
jgi:hypothetical protein